MANHSSVTMREETPHVNKSIKNKKFNPNLANSKQRTVNSEAVRRRAQSIINDRSIDAETRALIWYGLEVNDPWLADLVRRLEAGETIIETIVVLKHPKPAARQ